ncbi:ABC transporter ATP-binding protein [Streptococcus pneumoniae]|nr:ABC transporter ATP-binding protein [Streptococcus pneumoniae]CJA27219.1 ABC transporter ATP-binding protein [Streptococcus pneumoniae]CJA27278.1 ABC transporter ATP-binding protein [Streptococcus pneumoniae]CJF32600.1 ABC transporter ATP-binding protein [Streptococcus pneumoniae]COD60272.1 ABC transporter ATP-binding protein [Streptococcus pneumoniae]
MNINGGIKNVSKHYGHSIILKDINFALNKGEIVGLVGRNGVGKSTLMKILVQNNQPTSGNIISSDNVLKKFVRGFFSWRAGF